jgi:hypothetical protein
VHLEVTRNTDRAGKFASREPRSNRARLLVQLSGNNRKASMTGTSPRASVRETSVWQLAVLAKRRSILRSDTHRMRTLLGNRGVVDHQHGIAAADESVRLNKQFCLHRRRIPDPGGNEVAQYDIRRKTRSSRP